MNTTCCAALPLSLSLSLQDTPVPSINMMVGGDCIEVFGNYTSLERDMDSNCCPSGMLTPALSRSGLVMIIWLLVLFWIFLGVALGADVFMQSIEVLTSKEKTIKKKDPKTGEEKIFHVRVWNATVANLTLMALGSSAPEILLSVIEIGGNGFYAGELGPSTIVGSAAFNMLVISAVCVMAIPDGSGRLIKELGVFAITAVFSVAAYLWLLVILTVITPNVVDVWEGFITFILFPLLVWLAYLADQVRHLPTSPHICAHLATCRSFLDLRSP